MKLTLKEKRPEVQNVTTFIFEPEGDLSWKAGQYLHYTLHHPNTDDRGNERWFTVSAAPYEKNPQITTRHSEKSSSFKNKLFSMEIGESIEADGPEGEFVVENPEQEFVFIAGGIGITPFRSILLDLDKKDLPINVTLFYINRTDDFVFKEELDALAKKRESLSLHYCIEPEPNDAVLDEITDYLKPNIYLSGPEPMVKDFAEKLKGRGVPEDHLKLDDFPGYEWLHSSEG